MSDRSASSSTEPAAGRSRRLDAALGLAAAGGWTAALLLPAGAGATAAAAAAAALTAAAVALPWSRRQAERAAAGATAAARRDVEEALASAAKHGEEWRAIVDTATEGIVTIDARGHVETVNNAALRLFGYRRDELVGRNVAMLMPSPQAAEHDNYLARYLQTGERRVIGIGREVVGLRKDGGTFPIDLSIGEGAIDGRPFFTAVMRDVTERAELQAKLAQSERLAAVGELAAGVAHEINNPINTMINCAQLIQDGDEPAENGQIIVEEGARIADIVRALLQFARDDSDKAQPTSLSEVVDRTLSLVGESWQRHGVHIHVDVPDGLPLVHARPQKVQQVLLNLLINAKDALTQLPSERRRQVAIHAEARDGGAQLTVSDNGPGIPEAVRDRIFEPFVTTKRARGGTGLGLSVSRSIIEDYGGMVRVESPPGQGTKFTVWLPLAPGERAE